jgi:sugar phosphate isomerase/epimerase
MNDFSKLAIHTMTTKPWDFPTACSKYAQAGIKGVGVWRAWLEGRPLAESKKILDDHGLSAVSLVRGGFFVGKDAAARQKAHDENKRCLDEAAAIGAPQVVLVCGALPGIPLTEARQQITAGIAACVAHAAQCGVKLAIEPLHPMYASDRSAVNTIGQANDIIDQTGSEWVGIAADVYHIWWDPHLPQEIKRAGSRIIGFHVCDWLSPTKDLLNDRGLMGEGCIDIPTLRQLVEATGFKGFNEVEIFSDRWWAQDQDHYLNQIKEAYLKFC